MLWSIYQPLVEELGVEERRTGLLCMIAEQERGGRLHFDASLAGRRRLFSTLPEMVQRDAKVKDWLQNATRVPSLLVES